MENSGTIHPDHPLLTLPTIYKDTEDAWYTLRGTIAAPRHPTDQAISPSLNQMTNKHLITLIMFLLVAMCHQHTIHHQDLYLVLFSIPMLPGTFQKTELGTS